MNQHGFSVVEIIMAVCIVALLGGVGYLGYQSYAKKNEAAPKPAESSVNKFDDTNSQRESSDLTRAKSLVDEFYRKYVAEVNTRMNAMDSNPSDEGINGVIKQYSSTRLLQEREILEGGDVDPFFCVMGVPMTAPTAMGAVKKNDRIEVTVQEEMDGGSTVKFVVNVTGGEVQKIDGLTCPQ